MKPTHFFPFAAVLALLVLSVVASCIRAERKAHAVFVNTAPAADGSVYTVRVFDSISAVVAIDLENRAHKKELAASAYSYDKATTRLAFSAPLPYKQTVVHVEGVPAQPEQFRLAYFSGDASSLLVALNDRTAIEGYEYTYSPQTRVVTFRADLHPEQDGNFHISYWEEDGTAHGFGNWARKDADTLAALEWQWLHTVHGAPMMVMKERSGASNRALSREAGFSIRLPKGSATFMTETMEEAEKRVSVQRWYDDYGALLITCALPPFASGDVVSERPLTFGALAVTERRCNGVTTAPDGTATPAPLIEYTWEASGTHYQLLARPEEEAQAAALLALCAR